MHEDVQYILESLQSVMIGSEYIWQPENRQNPRAYARITVTDVMYNGDEILIGCMHKGEKTWNSLDVFLESIATKTGVQQTNS